MRITYLKLENLLSVQAGMNKRKIEIDFKKSRHKKILILGENGSGKSVILSSLSPYRETNDNRKNTPIAGKTGCKEITIEYDGDEYNIIHYYSTEYPSRNKSYITKNDEELNENGTIRTFNEIIEKELDITPDYFAIGRLGSNVSNFIDFPTAERKKYINKFIPNIDDYISAYENTNTKLLEINKRLKSLEVKLEKFKSIDELLSSKKLYEDNIESIENEISKLEFTIEVIQNDIDKNKKDIDKYNIEIRKVFGEENDINFDNLKEQLKDINKTLESYKIKFPDLFKDFTLEKLKMRIPELNAKIEINENKLETLTNERDKNIIEINKLEKENKSKLSRIKHFDNDVNKEELEKDANNYKNLLENTVNSINDFESNYTKDEIEYIKENILNEEILTQLTDIAAKLLDRYMYFSSSQLTEEDIILWKEYNSEITPIETLKKSNIGKLEKLEYRKDDLEKIINKINESIGFLDIIKESEHQDHVKECPFVPMLLNIKEEYTIEEIEKEYEKVQEYIKFKSTDLMHIDHFIESYDIFNKQIFSLRNNEGLSFLGIDEDDLKKLFTGSFTNTKEKLNEIDRYKEYYNLTKEYDKIKDKYDSIKEKISTKDEFEKIINEYHNEILENESTISSLNSSRNNLETNIEKISAVIKNSKITAKILKEIIELVTEEEELRTNLDAIDFFITEINLLEKANNDHNDKYMKFNSDIIEKKKLKESHVNELDKINRDYYTVDHTKKELETINEVLDYFVIIKESLDLKKGIPLIFTNNYLIDIAERTNDLLNIAYKGSFNIDFKIDKKDFNINVYKSDGSILDDISLASQGEIAMTNTTLSLAMMANVTKGFNIIYLDEVDATLDVNNRRNFLSVLDKQIDVLGSDQVFIISHNNEFYSSDVDLILLDGYEDKIDINDKTLMSNKEILYVN